MSKPLILFYQKIGQPPQNSRFKKQWTSLRTLTRRLDNIKNRHINTLSPLQLANAAPGKSVLLLFLGGYRSFYTEVYPLLKARGLSACVCLPTACVGTYNSWQDPYQEPWQDLLTWEEIRTLAQDPLISFGAMALQAQDITLLPSKEAHFLAQESLFRLSKQLSKPPELFALYPAVKSKWDASSILPDFPGFIWSPKMCYQGKNIVPTKNIPGNSWRAWIHLINGNKI